jgi:transcription-repair coupling factor (superfamily II helicase)
MLIEPEQLTSEGQAYLQRQQNLDRFHSLQDSMREIGRFGNVSTSALAPGQDETTCQLPIQSVERFSGDVGRVREELEHAGEGQQVFLVCQTEAEVQRLREIFSVAPMSEDHRLHFPVGRLKAGFHLASESVLLVSSGELFQRGDLRRPVRRHAGKAIDSFLDLRNGDLVVHLAHGIGRYRGMKLLTKEDQAEDHLEIEFHGGTKVFVPATKIDLIQKYVGSTRSRPTLAKIGGKSWVRQKHAAETAVIDMAAEMLELQAARAARPGISFGQDSDWQREFDASFPYHETPDQLSTMDSIKTDMRAARPMDRLLCGDVGFGKTELAMRAAFKAVDNGYQVAVLVPTTILAEQHHRTFQERIAEFPFEIAKLSRFCSFREQREIIERLSLGQIDVVIGTHRLASADVRFLNLGLVIIDEEQRFGVAVKERLKALRATVDVLTMTATPIPRTLHMSLTGIRDISNLETPPEDRVPVETRVTRWDETLIRHAVLRELNRNGQIFFVHNRVHDIDAVAKRLQRIVPEARMQIGHGQMPEGDLEQVMVDFVAHRFDLLLATTIVESGLDIPNANTIFIDDAERYGLADLHQLRGRVGRYKHRAYCYLLIAAHKHITPNAARRLRAIEEFSDMGAGFAIAMRDLEIRGAGNVLGTQQSGHIAAVGYEMYCQLLENAVRRLRHLPPKKTLEVNVDLPGEAYFPRDYVPDLRMKIDLYRRLSRVTSEEELSDLHNELGDRFGPPPGPVRQLLALTSLKVDASKWQINDIHLEPPYLVLGYSDATRIRQLSRSLDGRLRIVDERNAYMTMDRDRNDPGQILAVVESVLRCDTAQHYTPAAH